MGSNPRRAAKVLNKHRTMIEKVANIAGSKHGAKWASDRVSSVESDFSERKHSVHRANAKHEVQEDDEAGDDHGLLGKRGRRLTDPSKYCFES